MKSLAESRGQIVDLRQLQFSGTFFSLSEESADELMRSLCQFVIEEFGPQFILDWKMGSRTLKDINSFASRKNENRSYSIELSGNALCDRIYNKSSFRKYERDKILSIIPPSSHSDLESIDFAEYYDKEVAPLLGNNIQAKDALLKLLNLEGKYPRGLGLIPDIFAHFSSAPMYKDNMFYGEYTLFISSYCLGKDLDYWAGILCEFGKSILKKFANTNIRIELNPKWGKFYSFYFGQYPSQGDKMLHEIPFREHTRAIYVTEIGWAHLLCKRTLELGTINPKRSAACFFNNSVIKEKLEGGGLFVRASKPLSLAGVQDLKSVKSYLYDIVMPRSRTLSLAWKIRSNWQIVPVFDDELTIVGNTATFTHFGSINTEKLCQLLE